MKLLICILACCCVLHVNGQSFFFSRFVNFFCQNPQNLNHAICRTRSPPLPPTTTTTTRPTTKFIPPTTSRRAASFVQTSLKTPCERLGGRCSDGIFLADVFTANFLSTSTDEKKPSTNSGGSSSRPSGGSSGRGVSGGTSGGGGSNSGSSGRGGSTSSFLGRSFLVSGNSNPSTSQSSSNQGSSAGSTSITSVLGRQLGRGSATNVDSNLPCVTTGIVNSRGQSLTGSCRRVSNTISQARRKRQTYQPVTIKRDLVILMDESGSVGYHRFEKVKRIAGAIIRLLCEEIRVHPQYTRVAITSFDSQVHPHRPLRSPRYSYYDYNGNALANWIGRNIFYNSRTAGSTCLIDALNYVYTTVLSSRNGGRRGDPYVEQDIILISDGCENCVHHNYARQEVIRMTQMFIQANINVYVIGIGIREQCKETLSLLAQGGKCFHFFYLTNWDYVVDEFLKQLENPPGGICLNSFETAGRQCVANIGG